MGELNLNRENNIQYVLSLSYGKDSLACIEAIRQLDMPLNRIIHAEMWATDTIPAELPPMAEFKKRADKIIKERYGIEVEHVCAIDKTMGGGDSPTKNSFIEPEIITNAEKLYTDSPDLNILGATVNLNSAELKLTYERKFYKKRKRGKRVGEIEGFPILRGNWCTSLKTSPIADF